MAWKRCPYCGEGFEPKPHLAGTQICCGKKSCKAMRKAEGQAHWVKKNPEYFKGDYRRTRLWLAEHPGYLQVYRAGHPEYVRKDNEKRRERHKRARRRADIQDAWPRLEIRRIAGVEGADIQDTCRLRLDGLLYVLGGAPAPIYKTLSPPREAPG